MVSSDAPIESSEREAEQYARVEIPPAETLTVEQLVEQLREAYRNYTVAVDENEKAKRAWDAANRTEFEANRVKEQLEARLMAAIYAK